VLLALALTLAGCLEGDEADEPFWGVELPGEAASDFTLVDQHGDNFSLVDTTGKVVVMTFVYTNCIEICLPVTHKLRNLQEALGDDYGERVEILSITVDPERDTVEHLANWSMMRNASWPHLTSSAMMAEMAMNNSVWGPYSIYVEKVVEDQELTTNAKHSLVIMLSDNSTYVMDIAPSAFDPAATVWNLTQEGLGEQQLDYNYTGADFVTDISGHEANNNWSWTLHVWNASSRNWEPTGTNATDIPLTESVHAAWMPGNANISQLPLPSAFSDCDGHGWLMGEGSGMHCMCDEGYGWPGQDRLSCVLKEGAGGYGDYGINHSTILYIIDQQGRLKVAWPGLDWTYRDVHHDVVLLLD